LRDLLRESFLRSCGSNNCQQFAFARVSRSALYTDMCVYTCLATCTYAYNTYIPSTNIMNLSRYSELRYLSVRCDVNFQSSYGASYFSSAMKRHLFVVYPWDTSFSYKNNVSLSFIATGKERSVRFSSSGEKCTVSCLLRYAPRLLEFFYRFIA